MCFAHMKRIFKLDRLRLRGLSGAKDEVLLTATAQNLRRLVRRHRPHSPVWRSYASAAGNTVRCSQRRHLTKTQKPGSAAKAIRVLQHYRGKADISSLA